MNYKLFIVPAVSLLAAACDFKGNLYPMTPQQAYDKLVSAPIERSGKGPFGTMDISASGDGSNTVRWGNGFVTMCEANITPEGTDKSRIMAYCGAGGEGAAAGMTQALYRKAIIEHIDSTLRGRPYDRKLAYGTTAGLWPDDPRQANGSIGVAAGEALKMERDMRKDMAEMDKMADQMEAERAAKRANGDVNFKPGQPMINPSK
jgi:hypothetical protein